MIWNFLFHPYGLLNPAWRRSGCPPGLADRHPAVIPGSIRANQWRFAPYFMVLYLAGLQDIDRRAPRPRRSTGPNARQRFWYIALPLYGRRSCWSWWSPSSMSKVFTNVLVISTAGPTVRRVISLFIYQPGSSFSRWGSPAPRRSDPAHHGLHPGPDPDLPDAVGPWLARTEPAGRAARRWDSCCSSAARS